MFLVSYESTWKYCIWLLHYRSVLQTRRAPVRGSRCQRVSATPAICCTPAWMWYLSATKIPIWSSIRADGRRFCDQPPTRGCDKRRVSCFYYRVGRCFVGCWFVLPPRTDREATEEAARASQRGNPRAEGANRWARGEDTLPPLVDLVCTPPPLVDLVNTPPLLVVDLVNTPPLLVDLVCTCIPPCTSSLCDWQLVDLWLTASWCVIDSRLMCVIVSLNIDENPTCSRKRLQDTRNSWKNWRNWQSDRQSLLLSSSSSSSSTWQPGSLLCRDTEPDIVIRRCVDGAGVYLLPFNHCRHWWIPDITVLCAE